MPPVVTTVTTRAHSADQLTEQDYRDIYDEVRGRDPATGDYSIALRVFVRLIAERLPGQEVLSIGYWSKYHNGEITLNRRARQELRALVGLPALPPTVQDATATIDPDATVYQVGTAAASRVVMVGQDVTEPLLLHLNGRVEIIEDNSDDPANEASVTTVTTPKAPRKPSKAIRVSPQSFDRLQRIRTEANMTWDEFAIWVAELCGE